MRRRTTHIGRSGEFWAAHLFELHGMQAHHVNGDVDLYIDIGGKVYRVEVKTASGLKHKRYHYRVAHSNADFYAFVALDIHLMRIIPNRDINVTGSFRLNASDFSEYMQANDMQEIKKGAL